MPNISIRADEVEGYVRLSREDIRGSGSMEEKFALRRQICLNLAKQNGWPLTEDRIRWEQESGTKLSSRPEAMALLDNVRSGKTRYLVTPYQDRLLRGDKRDEQEIEDAFCDAGLLLLTTEGLTPFDENYDTTHALVFGVKAAVARHFVADLVKKRKETDYARLQQNVRCRGFAPYGYRYLRPTYDDRGHQLTPQRHEVIPEQYEIVCELLRRIWTESIYAIAADLNARAVPPPGENGRCWHRSSLSKIFANPWYAGHYAQRYKVKRGQKHHSLMNRADFILSPVEGDFEHPITLAEWYELQALLESRVHNSNARQTLLSGGVLRCCNGKQMVGVTGKCYRCFCTGEEAHAGYNVSRRRLDLWAKEIVTVVVESLPDDALVVPAAVPQRKRTSVEQEMRQARTTLQDRQKELTDLIRQSVRLSSRFNSEEFDKVIAQVTAERDEAQKTMERLQAALLQPDIRATRTLLQRVRAIGLDVFWNGDAQRPAATLEQQRALIQAVVRQITLDPIPEGWHTVRSAQVDLWELGQPKQIQLPKFIKRRP